MTQHFANQKRGGNGSDLVQSEKKKGAPKVLSTIALIFAVLALVCGILSPLMIANPVGSTHLNNQAVLEIGGHVPRNPECGKQTVVTEAEAHIDRPVRIEHRIVVGGIPDSHEIVIAQKTQREPFTELGNRRLVAVLRFGKGKPCEHQGKQEYFQDALHRGP